MTIDPVVSPPPMRSDTMNELLDFNDLTPIEVPVSVQGRQYTLREASGDAACQYRNAVSGSYQYGPDGNISGVKGLSDAGPLLVSLCLVDENGRAVKQEIVRGWPARVMMALFRRAKEISELDEPETVESLERQVAVLQRRLVELQGEETPSGNVPGGTTVGSD